MRLKRSRPSWSVPKRCWAEGGASRSMGAMAFGLWVATSGASSATASSRATAIRPKAPARVAVTWPMRRAAAFMRSSCPPGRGAQPRADPRIDPGIGEIDQQIGGDEEHDDDEHSALDHRIVPGLDGAVDQRAQPRPVEDHLGEDGAA